MNKEKFWELIETAKIKSHGDLDEMYNCLVTDLSKLEESEIIIWAQIFDEYQRLSYKEKLWAAAYVIHDGCSDDAFDYFRAWLTAQGKTVFLNALKNPDSLADVEEAMDDECWFEDMLSVACEAYSKKINIEEDPYHDALYTVLNKDPLPDDIKTEMMAEIKYAKDIDVKWDEDKLTSVVPNLCKKAEWEDEDSNDDEDDCELEDGSALPLHERLAYWHEKDQHTLIIEEINNLPEDEKSYDVIGILARAYNNSDEEEKAIETLETVRDQGETDPLWLFRYGYALYYLNREEEALMYFEKCKELNPNEPDIDSFLTWCRERIQEKEASGEAFSYNPEMYSDEEIEILEAHIEKYFGKFDHVFHEIVSLDIHLDIAIINPTEERNYYTLITMGMGAHKMNIPEELADKKLERAEVLITLPPNWKIQDNDEKWYWPMRWLKILARLPIEEDSWLGFGHTIPNAGPFAKNTKLDNVILLAPACFGEKSYVCPLPDGDEVNFYQMFPLYNEECEYKINNSAEDLIAYFPEDFDMVVDVKRKNYLMADYDKNYKTPALHIKNAINIIKSLFTK